jgi:hypothetical protein
VNFYQPHFVFNTRGVVLAALLGRYSLLHDSQAFFVGIEIAVQVSREAL